MTKVLSGIVVWFFMIQWGAIWPGIGATMLITVFFLALPVALGYYKFEELPDVAIETVPANVPASPDFDEWEKEL